MSMPTSNGYPEHPTFVIGPREVAAVTAALAWRLMAEHDTDMTTREWLGQALARLTTVGARHAGVEFPSGDVASDGVVAVVHRTLDLFATFGPSDSAMIAQHREDVRAIWRRLFTARWGIETTAV